MNTPRDRSTPLDTDSSATKRFDPAVGAAPAPRGARTHGRSSKPRTIIGRQPL
jgi:hypothetical protein